MSLHDDHRYVIIGAGAIGGTLGGVLARAGITTLLIARGRNAEVLASAGITLRTPGGNFRTALSTASRPEDVRLTERDVLVFAPKPSSSMRPCRNGWISQYAVRMASPGRRASYCRR